MKKIITVIIASACVAVSAGAQSMYDAINFGTTNYYGTARSIAVGNAVTAVGGDLGSVTVNPAGAAVAGYSQFTFSPGLSVMSNSGIFGTGADNSRSSTRRKDLFVPNIAVVLDMPTGKYTGLKSFTLGFVCNVSNSYLNGFDLSYRTDATSKFAENAAAAEGLKASDLNSYNAYYDTDINWDLLTAYQANLFSDYGFDGKYAGNSATVPGGAQYSYIPGVLRQRVQVEKTGLKRDMVFNLAGNISDRLFIGFNLGVPSSSYGYTELYSETPENADKFAVTFYKNDKRYDTNYLGGSTAYGYSAELEGIYGQIGVIALPFRFLRLGASFKTPALLTVKESWQYKAKSQYGNSMFNGSAKSPEGEYVYDYTSPYSASFGAALTIGQRILLSADYELTDFSVMSYSSSDSGFSMGFDPFVMQNELIGNFCGVSHAYRLGAEFRLTPALSLRCGYSKVTDPEKYYTDEFGKTVDAGEYEANYDIYHARKVALVSSRYSGKSMSSTSFGVGYSTKGSFFADFAFRTCFYNGQESYLPYYDYTNYNKSGDQVNVASPRVSVSNRKLMDYVLTLGWRF